MDPKKKAVLRRIKHLEEAIAIGRAYLESGTYAHWFGFRPLFIPKMRGGKRLPPHTDWVRNVYIPGMERALGQAEKALERLDASARHVCSRCAGE